MSVPPSDPRCAIALKTGESRSWVYLMPNRRVPVPVIGAPACWHPASRLAAALAARSSWLAVRSSQFVVRGSWLAGLL